MMNRILLWLGVLCLAVAVEAQTPDQLPPANEGVCDELISATPGLYGLCVAFCEAQDCYASLTSEDPFDGCLPSSPKLLEVYNKKKQAGDPDMPCVQQESCPCWTEDELDGLRFQSGAFSELNLCAKDSSSGGFVENLDFWETSFEIRELYQTRVETREVTFRGVEVLGCFLRDMCADGNCLGIVRGLALSPEEYALCEDPSWRIRRTTRLRLFL